MHDVQCLDAASMRSPHSCCVPGVVRQVSDLAQVLQGRAREFPDQAQELPGIYRARPSEKASKNLSRHSAKVPTEPGGPTPALLGRILMIPAPEWPPEAGIGQILT